MSQMIECDFFAKGYYTGGKNEKCHVSRTTHGQCDAFFKRLHVIWAANVCETILQPTQDSFSDVYWL